LLEVISSANTASISVCSESDWK